MSPKRIGLVIVAALAFVGGIVLLILRQRRLAGLLRASAEGALIKHDLAALELTRNKLWIDDKLTSDRSLELTKQIRAKEAEAIAKPMKLRGATPEEIDNELRNAGLLR